MPIPAYAHPGDAGADLVTAVDVELGPGERALVGTGIPHLGKGNHPTYLRKLEAVMSRTSGVRRWGAAALDVSTTNASLRDRRSVPRLTTRRIVVLLAVLATHRASMRGLTHS